MSDRFRTTYLALTEEARRHPGEWEPSPHEAWKSDYFSRHCTEGTLQYFRRSRLAGGLLNFPDRPSRLTDEWRRGLSWKERIIGAGWLWDEYRLLLRHFRKQGMTLSAGDLRDDGLGYPCGYWVPGIGLVTEVAMRQAYYRQHIISRMGTSLGRVLEIGAGYGMLCAALMARDCIEQYIIVDLPENMVLEWFYLGRLFSNKVHLVYEEAAMSVLPTKGIVILAPWLLPKLVAHSGSVDLFVNTVSFQHMTSTNVAYYFSWIDALRVHRLYLVNRDFKREPHEVEISRFPIPPAYRLVTKRSWAFTKYGDIDERWYERTEACIADSQQTSVLTHPETVPVGSTLVA